MDQGAAVAVASATLLCGLAPQALGQAVPDSATARRDAPEMRSGFGFSLTGEEARQRGTMWSVFLGIPSVRVVGFRNSSFRLHLATPAGGMCMPTLYIDGLASEVEELTAFRPAHVARIDVYARPSTAPFLLPDRWKSCGVIAVWTTTSP
jgi:hypothetical protein